jgi:hypothetical protein
VKLKLVELMNSATQNGLVIQYGDNEWIHINGAEAAVQFCRCSSYKLVAVA